MGHFLWTTIHGPGSRSIIEFDGLGGVCNFDNSGDLEGFGIGTEFLEGRKEVEFGQW